MSTENNEEWSESVIAFQIGGDGYLISDGLKTALIEHFERAGIKAVWSVAGGIDLCIGMATCRSGWRVAIAALRDILRGYSEAELFWLDTAEQIFRPLKAQSRQMTFADFGGILDRLLGESKRIEEERRELIKKRDAAMSEYLELAREVIRELRS